MTPVIYVIDTQDRLIAVNRAWLDFACSNGGTALHPDTVVGRSLWEFITDETLFELYRHLIHRARSGQAVSFTFRCDSPDARRTFELTLQPRAPDAVEFSSRLITSESRPPVAFLQPHEDHPETFISMCSWCQRLATPDRRWICVEEAVAQLPALSEPAPPRITHGICPECLARMKRLIAGR